MSNRLKLFLVVAAYLGSAIAALVHWSDMITPNWIGGTLAGVVPIIYAAYGIVPHKYTDGPNDPKDKQGND